MKTKVFCELIERAINEEYGEESNFDTVPYVPEEGGPMKQCLGVFLLEGVHMAHVAARAMYFIWQDADGLWNDDADKDEALGDFADLMGGMKVAPYMQWHCAYFPGLTADQIEPEDPAVMSAESLYAEFENLRDVTTQWYSGRGMMGKECLAISGTQAECMAAISTVVERMPEATRTLLNDTLRTDNLGHDVVIYWTLLERPEQ